MEVIPPADRSEAIKYFGDLFGNSNPLVVEIGSGNGHFLVDYARTNPDKNFIGIEMLWGRAKKFHKKVEKRDLKNVAVFRGDARIFIWEFLYESMVEEFIILFPDPWPKTRHHKHRLLKKGFIEMLHFRLVEGGVVSIATDHTGYRDWIMDAFSGVKGFRPLYEAGYSHYPEDYPATLFHSRLIEKGCEIYFLRYIKS